MNPVSRNRKLLQKLSKNHKGLVALHEDVLERCPPGRVERLRGRRELVIMFIGVGLIFFAEAIVEGIIKIMGW